MVFNAYAAYYDLLYEDKNYPEEAMYVHQLIQKHCANAKTVLDLGCGTGKHAAEFFKLGYEVAGVDISARMIQIAETNCQEKGLQFHRGDIRDIRLGKTFDVVGALFHVMCYQTGDEDLLNALTTAAIHLKDDGLLIFDCWYGPGVLNDLPTARVKKMENAKIEVERLAQPHFHFDKNMVTVDYQVCVKQKEDNSEHLINEKHQMRYLFIEEVETMAQQLNLKMIGCHEWLKFDDLGSKSCWNVAFVLKKAAS